MQSVSMLDAGIELDPVEEMRLRTWARRHYTPSTDRDVSWHPVILDEMRRKDGEQGG